MKLFNLTSKDIGIDLGTANILINSQTAKFIKIN